MIPPELAPYVEIGACLFPLPAGSKSPVGIIANWRTDASRDPAQIEQWAADHPGCNWGLFAAASGLIICDIDVKNVGREAAWKAWCDVCASWNVAPIEPTISTPSGGWHVYLRVGDVDPGNLKQPALVKGVIDVRANGFVLIPPSVVDGKPYASYS